MGQTTVKLDFNLSSLKIDLKNAAESVKEPLMNQVLTDSNKFCRQAKGGLIKSSETMSSPKDGRLVWDTPYAKRVYYTGVPVKDVNSNASLMWYHKAAETNGKEWAEQAKKSFKKGLNR